MDKCNEYMELISAYADGELTESDKRKTEEHLQACPDCSSILEAYRSISLAVDEACVPAPKPLCAGVMERIKSDNAVQIAEKMKKYKTVNMIMTRYLPMAACLVFLLLTVPRIIGIGRYEIAPGSGGASLAPSALDMAAGAQEVREFSMAANSDENSKNEESGSYDDDTIRPVTGTVPDAPAPVDTPAPQAPAAMPQEAFPPSDIAMNDADIGGDGGNEATGREQSAIAAEAPQEQHEPQEEESLPPPHGMSVNAEWAEMDTNDSLHDVYAIIMITGELPLPLGERVAFGASDNFALVLEITRDEAEALIGEIEGREGVEFRIINENGAYAIVEYTP